MAENPASASTAPAGPADPAQPPAATARCRSAADRPVGERRRRQVPGRRRVVSVKLSEAEHAAIRARAAAAGLSVAAFLAGAAEQGSGGLGVAGMTVAERRVWAAELLAVRRVLSATGNNVNQLARRANAGQAVDPVVAQVSVQACRRAAERAADVLEHLRGGRT